MTVSPDCSDAHCSYTGAAKVEPAPEIVPEPLGGVVAVLDAALALELVDALVDEVVDELELPHAASPTPSAMQLANAPILFLVTRFSCGLNDVVGRAACGVMLLVPLGVVARH